MLIVGTIPLWAEGDRYIANYSRPFGIGVILGFPTGLVAKYWTKSSRALGFGLAYNFDDFLLMHVDYLWHARLVTHNDFFRQLAFYIGVGPALEVRSRRKGAFAIRVPLGVEFRPALPLGIDLQISPAVELFPAVDIILFGGIAFKYYF